MNADLKPYLEYNESEPPRTLVYIRDNFLAIEQVAEGLLDGSPKGVR